jgi:hypothetical protein
MADERTSIGSKERSHSYASRFGGIGSNSQSTRCRGPRTAQSLDRWSGCSRFGHGRVPGIVRQLLELGRIDSQGGSSGEYLANLRATGRGRARKCEQPSPDPAMITHVHNCCRDLVQIFSNLNGLMLRSVLHGRESLMGVELQRELRMITNREFAMVAVLDDRGVEDPESPERLDPGGSFCGEDSYCA